MRLTHVAWNALGLATPLVAAAVAVPRLLQQIGTERFGLLTLAWGLIGFAGIFDLGIGRATTQAVSQLRGTRDTSRIPHVVRSGERLAVLSGLLGTVVLCLPVALGAQDWMNFSPGLRGEVTLAAYVLAFAIPAQSLSAMYRGVNEAFENFREVSLLRMALGISTFLGPMALTWFTTDLAALVSTLLLSRLLALYFFRRVALRRLAVELKTMGHDPSLRGIYDPAVVRRLLGFGGWLTVTGIVYPVMMQADRFTIAGVLSSNEVAAYTIPYEIVVQTLVLVGAVTTAAFPRLAMMAHDNASELLPTFLRWLGYVTLVMALLSFGLWVSLPSLLQLWLGSKVPEASAGIGQVLCFGLVPYTVGTMYASIIHAHGRPDITAKSHLLQLPVYLGLVYWLAKEHGLVGVAWAWNLRVAADTIMVVTWFHLGRLRERGLPES
jgi:O-antigen/teichoic acid export membrane protein